LIDSEKNKIGWCRRLPTFTPKQVLKALFTTPRCRDKWDIRKKMTGKNQACPKNADESEDQKTMTSEPVHAGV
jgi:hypothetical protein